MKITAAKSFYLKSSLFTILSLLAAVCSYAVYPILVHVLSPSDFGDFAVASATLNQVLAVLLAINIISIMQQSYKNIIQCITRYDCTCNSFALVDPLMNQRSSSAIPLKNVLFML